MSVMQTGKSDAETFLADGYRKIAITDIGNFIIAETDSESKAICFSYDTGVADLNFGYLYQNIEEMWLAFNSLTRQSIIAYVTEYMQTTELQIPTYENTRPEYLS